MKQQKVTESKIELLKLYKQYLLQAKQTMFNISMHENEHDNSYDSDPDYHNDSHDNTPGYKLKTI